MMAKPIEPISVRTMRINQIILGHSQAASKTSRAVADALSREGLLDAFTVLYNECDKDVLKKKDKNVLEFVNKYRSIIEETQSLRVNVDDFHVKTLIGKGYFGNVHVVSEKSTGDIYAMKKIKKSVVTTTQVKEERDIMASRSSEWITHLQYAFQDNNYLYLVMEFLPGGDLLSLMTRNGPFDEDFTRFYMAELTLAINAVHRMGYVHRDIKPENILVDRFGHIKLADFGNAASLNKDGHVMSMSPVGTPDYIAPELLQTISTYKLSKSLHDVTCDFWSMGIIGFEMMCETTPFHEENVHETYSKILSHCDESDTKEVIVFPADIRISQNCKSLIESLVTGPSKRFTFDQILKHQFFDSIKWETLRQTVPPIIPVVSRDDDTSNFDNLERVESRKSTFIKKSLTTNLKSNDFCGKDLPFLGYSYVHTEKSDDSLVSDDTRVHKMLTKIKELQKMINNSTTEITTLQQSLLKAEQKANQMDSQSKILSEAKSELEKMKNRLKEKTIELAACKTEIKTLKSSLKIEEEMRLKSEATISEVLSATYKKWEKAKSMSDQNYEKQIAEKKTEISNIVLSLDAKENELAAKLQECQHLQSKIENYKEMLKTIKDQSAADKMEFEKNKAQLIETYEQKMIEVRNKLRLEKDNKSRLTMELRDVRSELSDSICSTNSNKEIQIAAEKNIDNMKHRLNREIETNNNLRAENAELEKRRTEAEESCDTLKVDNEKLRNELQLIEMSKHLKIAEKAANSEYNSPYETAHGSLTELHQIEEQLRNDLAASKDNEDIQRKRAENLEKVVARLEDMVAKLSEQPKSVGDMLEKQNEKLEDKLVAVREQLIVERQSARTANLNLWKVEKKVEDLQHENNMTKRRMELTEEKIKKVLAGKEELERKLKEAQDIIKQKEQFIDEKKAELLTVKRDVQTEHRRWEKAEQERMKEKSEVVEQISIVHKLEDKISELKHSLLQSQKKTDSLVNDNNRLVRELNDERERHSGATDESSQLQMKLANLEDNYERLKYACQITDSQLTEIEGMLEVEQKRNVEKESKLDEMFKSLTEKNEIIANLKKDLNVEMDLKTTAEVKVQSLSNELEEMKRNMEDIKMKMINQQDQLIEQTNGLFEAHEKIELLSSESSNVHLMNENYSKELNILKEENSRILTDLFMSKEECIRLDNELKEASQIARELRQEIEELNGTLAEKQNFYTQRDIKSDATLTQHKKLIDYLQLKVEDLSQKKKKTLADKIFGSSSATNRKENISPNVVETSILYRTIHEELKRERIKNKVLQEQIEKLSSNSKSPVKSAASPTKSVISVDIAPEEPKRSSLSKRRRTYQTHRFELTLEGLESSKCIACHNVIPPSSPFWKCKECKDAVHRKCRSDVNTSCNGGDASLCDEVDEPCEKDEIASVYSTSSVNEDSASRLMKEYQGDLILNTFTSKPSLEINCLYEMDEGLLLFGCTTGLYSYQMDTGSLVHISGIESVNYIAVFAEFAKAILVGSNGEYLYQCDLRHLKTRSQASACMKPKLDAAILDLPFANRASNEKWQLVKISNGRANTMDCQAIAATSARIVILKYDWDAQKFKPVRALDTATSVSSILFTEHTAIVSSDKFFEIDLDRYFAEEFVDLSDQSLSRTRTCQSMAAFKISAQEYLLCFMECGIFVDQYGCRSRPYDLNWQYTPTGFVYRQPLLYIAHFHSIQVIRLHRSFSKEMALESARQTATEDEDDDDEGPNFKRTFLNFYMPTLLGESGNLNIYALATQRDTGIQELYFIDGIKSFKENSNISLETLSSQATCVTADTISRLSSDTL